jgi:hypothetical protein
MAESKIKITAETSQAEQALGTLGEKLKDADERFLGLRGAVLSLGAALSAGALTEMVKGSIEAADKMGKLAQQSGVSVESLSRLSIAARLSDVDNQSLAAGLGKLSKSMVDAQDGSGGAAMAFKALGISVKDSEGKLKSSDVVLKEIADKFSNAKDSAAKTAIALEIFGKSGASLIPMLNGGSDEMDRFAELSDRLGLTIGGKTSDAAQKINDQFTIMGMALQGVGMKVAQQMMPTFEQLSQVLLDTATNTDSLNAKADAFTFVLKTVVATGMGAAQTFETMGKLIGALGATVMSIAQGEFKQALNIMREASDDFDKDIEGFSQRIDHLWEKAEAKKEDIKSGSKKDDGKGDLKFGKGNDELNKKVQASLTALQNETFQKQMQVLGVLSPQIKVYELAILGASDAQLKLAQSSAEALEAANQQLENKKQEEAWQANLAKRLEAIQIGAMSEQEIEQGKLIAIQNDLDLALKNRWLTEEEYHRASLQAQLQYEAKLGNVMAQGELARQRASQKSWMDQAGMAASWLSEITRTSATKNREMFELNKIAGISETTVNTYRAAQGAYAALAGIPIVGPALGAGAAAIAIAAGLANIEAISSAQFGSSSSAPSIGGGSAVPVTTAPNYGASQQQAAPPEAPRQQLNITLVGSSIDYNTMVNDFVPLLQRAASNGALDIQVMRA